MLYRLIQPYKSISIIGMCKNAGKTTVLNGLIRACDANDECIGLTSIGRDGERNDLVTNTKKPEIFVRFGTLAATAKQALELGTISREIVGVADMPNPLGLPNKLSITTPMGEIILMRAMSDGFIQLAGPSMTVQIQRIRDELFALGAKRVLIDGALSRKSLAMPAVSDGTILCSGASYSSDMEKTVADTAYAVWLMRLPRTKLEFIKSDAKYIALTDNEALEFSDISEAAVAIRRGNVKALLMRGGVTDAIAKELMTAGRLLDDIELVCEDGSRLLLSRINAEKLLRVGAVFSVLNTTKLLVVTVNPFSAYGNHYDKNEFTEAVRARVPQDIPIINLMEGDMSVDK